MQIPSLNIIGAGKVGQTLGRLFQVHHCFKINGICNINLESAQQAAQFIGAGIACEKLTDLPPADVYMISTPDSQITSIDQALAKIPSLSKNHIVFHCSGGALSTEMACLANKGVRVASMHPLMTFAAPAISVNHFAGVHCAFEGDASTFEILQNAFTRIGGVVFPISTEKKIIYHTATALTCNHLIALMDIACDLLVDAGLSKEQALTAMKPIVEKTIQNIFSLGTVNALTGPIARGDADIVQRHIQAIDDIYIKNLYSTLGLRILKLAEKKGDASKESLAKIRDILCKE